MSAAPDSGIRMVYVPGKRLPLEVAATPDPGTYRVASQTRKGRWYEVRGADTAHARCNCEAASWGTECSHVIAAMEVAMSQPAENEPTPITQAVAISRPVPSRYEGMKDRAIAMRRQSANYSGTFIDLVSLAQGMAKANLLPVTRKGDNYIQMPAEAAAIVMMKAQELAIPPISAFEFLYVIGNKVGVQSQMVQALVQRSGLGKIEILESDEKHCKALGTRDGYRPLPLEYTWQDAVTAGHPSGKNAATWRANPKDMLRWKAIARVGRLMFADVLGGMDVSDRGEVIDSVADEGEYVVDARTEHGTSDFPTSNEGPEPEPIEGEFVEPEPEPEEPAIAYPWADEFTAALLEAPIGMRDICQMLGVASAPKPERTKAIDSWLNPAIGEKRTAKELISHVADWRARQP